MEERPPFPQIPSQPLDAQREMPGAKRRARGTSSGQGLTRAAPPVAAALALAIVWAVLTAGLVCVSCGASAEPSTTIGPTTASAGQTTSAGQATAAGPNTTVGPTVSAETESAVPPVRGCAEYGSATDAPTSTPESRLQDGRLRGGGATAAVSSTTSTAPEPRPAASFDAGRAMAHIKTLATGIGVRRAGSEAEAEAAEYAGDYLIGLGYEVRVMEVPLPNGLISRNVVAVKAGSSPSTIVVGGHLDSRPPSPGGNDNASGAAAVLELARDVRDADLLPTLVFVLFGSEETIDGNPDHHHYGSRAFVQQMTSGERADMVAMISLDMVAYGDTLTVRTMGQGPSRLRDMLLDHARTTGVDLVYLKDSSSFGASDHEPFELAGYPAVWLEWRKDPHYHTGRDTYGHCDPSRVQMTGDLTLGFLAGLTLKDLEDLRAAR